jgi:hypothetical protein
VNFVLVGPPLEPGMMAVGFVYIVFPPSIMLTPPAGVGLALAFAFVPGFNPRSASVSVSSITDIRQGG